jgi:hypothetical protein
MTVVALERFPEGLKPNNSKADRKQLSKTLGSSN